MQRALGVAYTKALRTTYRDDVPESADLVMYWWATAATLAAAGKVRRFGLITTNSITQGFSRKVVERALTTLPMSLVFAVPDHPWTYTSDGAAVRIAMTVGQTGTHKGTIATVTNEKYVPGGDGTFDVTLSTGVIRPALSIGADVSQVVKLKANRGLACPGVQLSGQGFVVPASQVEQFSEATKRDLIRPFFIGNDILKKSRGVFVIDAFGLTEDVLKDKYADAHQWLYDRVWPERAHNPREVYRKNWWVFSEPRRRFRAVMRGLPSMVALCRTAKHRVYTQIPAGAVAETTVIVFAVTDAWFFTGVLGSRVHETWVLAAGGTLEDRPRYNVSVCFDPFPFPEVTEAQRNSIGDIAKRIDALRKRQQAIHPSLTLTDLYNVLVKLRKRETLDAADKVIYERGLASVLLSLHDELDVAVSDAYGWPATLTDEEILVKVIALNAARAAEEALGTVRWLRPEFQKPTGVASVQTTFPSSEEEEPSAPTGIVVWPTKLAERFAAVLARIRHVGGAATAAQIAAGFKGAGPVIIGDVLDALASLGHVVAFADGKATLWKALGAAA